MTTTRGRDGAAAEQLAAAHLARHGLKVIERNYRCRGGEIDLVCADGEALVFVEVRYRSGDGFGGAAASVDRHKQRRLLVAARHYLSGKRERPCRFDVVTLGRLDADADAVEWIRDAFGA